MIILRLAVPLLACIGILGCGAQTDNQAAIPKSAAAFAESKYSVESSYLTNEEFEKYRRERTVEKVFKPAAGSSGNGEIMTALRTHGGLLSEPDVDYDVYDADSNLSAKELRGHILESLDRDKRVLLDSGDTPDARTVMAEISREATGASMDAAGLVIQKAPEDKGGYLLTPIYSRTDVEAQVAQGVIPNVDAQSNSIENFFFEQTGR